MDPASLIFALSAGMVTFFSPCSLPLLPAYVSYYLGLKGVTEGRDLIQREALREEPTLNLILRRGLLGGLMVSVGMIFIFGSIGVLTGFLGRVVAPYIRLMPLIVGPILGAMGVLMLLGLHPTFSIGFRASERRDWGGLFSYGVLYGLAAAGCSAPIFISIVFYAVSRGGWFEGTLTLLFYAVGMSAPLMGVTLLVTGAKEAAVQRLYQVMPIIRRIGALILILVGIYLLYYWHITVL